MTMVIVVLGMTDRMSTLCYVLKAFFRFCNILFQICIKFKHIKKFIMTRILLHISFTSYILNNDIKYNIFILFRNLVDDKLLIYKDIRRSFRYNLTHFPFVTDLWRSRD